MAMRAKILSMFEDVETVAVGSSVGCDDMNGGSDCHCYSPACDCDNSPPCDSDKY